MTYLKKKCYGLPPPSDTGVVLYADRVLSDRRYFVAVMGYLFLYFRLWGHLRLEKELASAWTRFDALDRGIGDRRHTAMREIWFGTLDFGRAILDP